MSELEYFKQWAAERYPGMPQATDAKALEDGTVMFYHDTLQFGWRAWQAGIEYITSRPTTNTRLDAAEFKKDNPETIVDRLRGIYPVPVPGQYKTAPVQHEAAREIERLRKDAQRYQYLRENLNRLQGMRPYHAPEPEKLDAAIDAALTDVQK